MSNSSKPYIVRRFLNPESGLAAIEAEIDKYKLDLDEEELAADDPTDGVHASIDANLSISDCGRTVNLDFSVYHYTKGAKYTEKHYTQLNNDIKKIIRKAHLLRDTIIDYTRELEARTQAMREQYHAKLIEPQTDTDSKVAA